MCLLCSCGRYFCSLASPLGPPFILKTRHYLDYPQFSGLREDRLENIYFHFCVIKEKRWRKIGIFSSNFGSMMN